MKDFDWAANKVKLQQACNALIAAKKLDDKIEITEETIKAEYIKRAGLVLSSAEAVVAKAHKAKKAE